MGGEIGKKSERWDGREGVISRKERWRNSKREGVWGEKETAGGEGGWKPGV